MPQNHFRAQLLQSAANFRKPQGFQSLQNWCPEALTKASHKDLRKYVEKASQLTLLTCLNCMRGFKNHDPEALGKRWPKAFNSIPFKRYLGSHITQDVQKQGPSTRYVAGIVFRGLPRFPRGGSPPVSGNSGGPVGRTTGGAEKTESLTRLMTPKGSAD